MKKETIKEIKEKSLEHLYKDVNETYKKLREVRFKVANREMKNTNEKRDLRKKIARIWTIVREKEVERIKNTN